MKLFSGKIFRAEVEGDRLKTFMDHDAYFCATQAEIDAEIKTIGEELRKLQTYGLR